MRLRYIALPLVLGAITPWLASQDWQILLTTVSDKYHRTIAQDAPAPLTWSDATSLSQLENLIDGFALEREAEKPWSDIQLIGRIHHQCLKHFRFYNTNLKASWWSADTGTVQAESAKGSDRTHHNGIKATMEKPNDFKKENKPAGMIGFRVQVSSEAQECIENQEPSCENADGHCIELSSLGGATLLENDRIMRHTLNKMAAENKPVRVDLFKGSGSSVQGVGLKTHNDVPMYAAAEAYVRRRDILIRIDRLKKAVDKCQKNPEQIATARSSLVELTSVIREAFSDGVADNLTQLGLPAEFDPENKDKELVAKLYKILMKKSRNLKDESELREMIQTLYSFYHAFKSHDDKYEKGIRSRTLTLINRLAAKVDVDEADDVLAMLTDWDDIFGLESRGSKIAFARSIARLTNKVKADRDSDQSDFESYVENLKEWGERLSEFAEGDSEKSEAVAPAIRQIAQLILRKDGVPEMTRLAAAESTLNELLGNEELNIGQDSRQKFESYRNDIGLGILGNFARYGFQGNWMFQAKYQDVMARLQYQRSSYCGGALTGANPMAGPLGLRVGGFMPGMGAAGLNIGLNGISSWSMNPHSLDQALGRGTLTQHDIAGCSSATRAVQNAEGMLEAAFDTDTRRMEAETRRLERENQRFMDRSRSQLNRGNQSRGGVASAARGNIDRIRERYRRSSIDSGVDTRRGGLVELLNGPLGIRSNSPMRSKRISDSIL